MNHRELILAAIDFIEDHIDEGELPFDAVANHVGMSPYHFHRIFSAMLGESASEYLRKRRLSKAALNLVRTETPIMELALNAGFESQEAFSRAFKKMCGVSPGTYRKHGRSMPIPTKQRTTLEMIEHITKNLSMEPEIVARDKQLAIGLGGAFSRSGDPGIKELWQRFLECKHEIENVNADFALGLCTSKHPDIAKKDGDSFVYIAALPVKSTDKIPQGMVACEIAAGRYARFTHKGPLSELAHTISFIWGTWIPRGEHKRREAPDFEFYDDRFNPDSADSEFDIFIPIE